MTRSALPFYFQSSHAVRELLGQDLHRVAVLAIKTVLKNQKSVEVAYQQIRFGAHHLALSSRVTPRGDLVVELDVGDPRLERYLGRVLN